MFYIHINLLKIATSNSASDHIWLFGTAERDFQTDL